MSGALLASPRAVGRAEPWVVAVDARPLRDDRTGVETYLGQLVAHLLEVEDLSLRLLVDRPWDSPYDTDRCTLVAIPPAAPIPRALGDGWIVSDVRRRLAREGADVFFTASTKFPPGRLPSVVTVHDLGWRRMPAAYTRSERIRQRLWTGWAARRASRLIAVSNFTRADLVAFAPHCEPRVRVIHEAAACGSGAVPGAAALRRARERLGLEAPFILAVGTLSPKKNLENLFAAFERLRARGFADHTLVVAGKRGWKAEPIVRAAQRTSGVRLLGYVDDETLRALYGAAGLYVGACPCEGFGLPLLEAMASGTPAVVADAGALPEVAGDAALRCAPSAQGLADAMAQVLGAPDLRARLAARGRRRAAGFSWRRAAHELAGVLREAAGEARA